MRVICFVVLPEGVGEIEGKLLQIIVEDVSYADRQATVIARRRVRPEELPYDGRQLGPIVLEADLPDPTARYNLRAILSSGEALAIGDLISTRSYPLPTSEDEATVVIHVQRQD